MFCEFEVCASKNQISLVRGIDGSSVLFRPSTCEGTVPRGQSNCKECLRTAELVMSSFNRVVKLLQITTIVDANHKLSEEDADFLRRFRKANCGPRDQQVSVALEKHRWVHKWRESSLVDGKLAIIAKEIQYVTDSCFYL